MTKINLSAKDFKKTFRKVMKNQNQLLLDAAAGALNDAGFYARKTLIDEFRDSFEVRSKKFPLGIKFTKAEPVIEKLHSEITFPEDWMYVHTTGGKKTPTDPGSHPMLSIPIDGQARDGRGRLRQRDKPQWLLKYANAHPTKSKGHGAVKRPFILKDSKGRAFIVKRDKNSTTEASRKPHNGDKFLYVLKPAARIDKRWDFKKIVKETITPAYMEKKFAKWVKFLSNKLK